MRKIVYSALAALILFVFVTPAAAQTTTAITCTDATNTNCTAKKNQPFSLTSDPADISDTVPTEKWRLYLDGSRVGEQVAVVGQSPVWPYPTGLTATGDHTFFEEAVGTCFDVNGVAAECSSGPSNSVALKIVTGSLSAPKNLRIVKPQ